MSVLDRFTLSGKVAIVTGAGQGIGKAIAIAFAQAGADVVCAARTLSDVEETADQIQALGRRSLAVKCDVTLEDERQALVAQTLEAFGKITHLVNCVGGGKPNDAGTLKPSQLNDMFHLNVTSSFALIQACLDAFKQANEGNIINISSAAARYIQPHFSAYGSTKAALTHLTKLLAQDFAPMIRVNAIEPGPIMTNALKSAIPESMLASMRANTPMKTIGTPEDIASAALFLATPASAWITGKVIEVDGGAESTVFASNR